MNIPARFRTLTPNLHARASLGRKIPLRYEPLNRTQARNAAQWIVVALVVLGAVIVIPRAWFG